MVEARSPATTKEGDAPSLSRDPSLKPFGTRSEGGRKLREDDVPIEMTRHTCMGKLNTKETDVLQCHTSHSPLASLSSSPVTPATSNNDQISLARLLSSRRKNA